MAKDAKTQARIIAGLDIGTTKVACAIGRYDNGQLDIIGVGQAPNSGMRHGVVVNIDATTEAIKKAKDEAELMAGTRADSVWLAVGGQHIQSFASSGMVAVRHKEVQQEDIDRVIEAAKAVAIPQDRQVLHVLPQDFKIDGQIGIFDPIGMSGVRLEASVFIVTGAKAVIQNAVTCAQRAGIKVEGLVLSQLASAMSVLSADEKNLGVCVVDMGGGTCDMIAFHQGSVIHTGLLPVGGHNFTHDVAIGLKTTQVHGETLKRKYGCALPEMVSEEESIEVESVGGRKPRTLMRRDLCEVLEARTEETLELIHHDLEEKGLLSKLGSGVVLTGGGALLHGLVEMGDFVLDVPVRRGWPEKVGGLVDVVRQPSCSTVVGVMMYGLSQDKDVATHRNISATEVKVADWTKKMKHLLGI
ncbi:MAG: cell division protein FtsA [Bdellovibrionales bacterium]|nr:cell division protein FtsA [Bdellovibrionales bacterium]